MGFLINTTKYIMRADLTRLPKNIFDKELIFQRIKYFKFCERMYPHLKKAWFISCDYEFLINDINNKTCPKLKEIIVNDKHMEIYFKNTFKSAKIIYKE